MSKTTGQRDRRKCVTTEEVFEELRTIVEKIDHCFSVYKHTDPDGLVYIGFCRNDPKQRWDYGGFSGERKNLPQKKEVHHAGKTAKRPVRCIETGELYPSANEAGVSKGIRPSSISAVCLGYHKTTHGYHWEYLYEKGTGDK